MIQTYSKSNANNLFHDAGKIYCRNAFNCFDFFNLILWFRLIFCQYFSVTICYISPVESHEPQIKYNPKSDSKIL